MNDNLFTITRKSNTKNGVIAWTEEQVHYITTEYLKGDKSMKELSALFGVKSGTLRNLLRKEKIQLIGNKRGYPRNEFYFHEIDTAEKAYWLGFLYADGCVHTDRNEVSINITDKEHVEKFQQAIGATNHKITITQDKRFPKAKTLYQFSIRDKQLHQDLIKWGCVPQKSLALKKIPDINKDYYYDFIRGFFDGDGGLWCNKEGTKLIFSLTGTFDFLTDIKTFLGFDSISLEQNIVAKNTYCLRVSGQKKVFNLLQLLYQNSTENTRLNRKYNLYQTFYQAHRP